MEIKILEALEKVSSLALEDWAMMLIDKDENLEQEIQNSAIHYLAQMTFKGQETGTVKVICTQEFVDNLCQNLLGLDFDQSPEEEDRLDSLKELANVLTGNFVTCAFGTDKVYDLVLPIAKVIDLNELKDILEGGNIQYFKGDEETLALTVKMEQ